jgi:hypothetical protein
MARVPALVANTHLFICQRTSQTLEGIITQPDQLVKGLPEVGGHGDEASIFISLGISIVSI